MSEEERVETVEEVIEQFNEEITPDFDEPTPYDIYTTEDEDDTEEAAEDTGTTPSERSSKVDVASFTDEEIDQVADTAITLLQDILKHYDVGEATIEEYEGDDGELILDITGGDLAVLIGRHGRTLESLQFMVSFILFRELGFRYPLVVDVEGYKNRQREKLEDIAQNAANRAVSQDRSIRLRPMSAYERRIVHMYLKGDDRVTTLSEGEGRNRRVVVSPVA